MDILYHSLDNTNFTYFIRLIVVAFAYHYH